MTAENRSHLNRFHFKRKTVITSKATEITEIIF